MGLLKLALPHFSYSLEAWRKKYLTGPEWQGQLQEWTAQFRRIRGFMKKWRLGIILFIFWEILALFIKEEGYQMRLLKTTLW